MMFFVPALGDLTSGISVVSHHEVVKIGCISDEAEIKDPSLMVALFNKNFHSLISSQSD